MHDCSVRAAGLDEIKRVRRHIAGAEHIARRRGVRLDPVRALLRSLLLDELARYRRRGRFPLNHDRRTRAVPHFVDSHGSRCAVAHLMDATGQGELVRHIAKTANNARVHELARLSEVRAWLAASGLSLEEAARIQPEYCFLSQAEACFCNQAGRMNLGLGTITGVDDLNVLVRIDRVEGSFPGVSVGDVRPVRGEGEIGEQLLFISEPGIDVFERIGFMLVIEDDVVRCQVNGDTRARPLSIDSVFEALVAEPSACVNVLATDDSGWNQSQCDDTRFENGSDGCGLAPVGIAGGGVTSAALLAALLALRYRRRQHTQQIRSPDAP